MRKPPWRGQEGQGVGKVSEDQRGREKEKKVGERVKEVRQETETRARVQKRGTKRRAAFLCVRGNGDQRESPPC